MSHQHITTAEDKQVVNPAYVLWNKKDQLVLSWLIATLTSNILSTVYGLNTSRQVWMSLASHYASQSKSRITHLKRQLQTMRQDARTCTEYLQMAKSWADQLAAIGKPVDEDDLISFILSGLNPSFNVFITTFNLTTRDTPLPYANFESRHPPSQLAAMVTQTNAQFSNEEQPWYADSSANQHITADLENLNITQKPYQGETNVADIQTGQTLLHGHSKDGLYPIPLHRLSPSPISNFTAFVGLQASTKVWHHRLGHLAMPLVHRVIHHHKLPISSSNDSTFFHSDVWQSPIVSLNGYRYYCMVENLLSRPIKSFQSDRGGEYSYTPFKNLLAQNGILHRFSCPHTSQQNGVAERKHRHVMDTGLALLAQSGLSIKYWVDAFLTTIYLINSKKCVFMGYSPHHRGYRCLDLSTHCIYISCDVMFNEQEFPAKTMLSLPVPNVPANPFESIPMPLPTPPGNSLTSTFILPPPPAVPATLEVELIASPHPDTPPSSPHIPTPPPASLLPPAPPLFPPSTTRMKADGSIDRHKARLVAKGFDQEDGIDYTETFSPVIKPTIIRVLLALAVHFNWSVRQLDVSNAFLHGSLVEEVFMEQPHGFVDPLFLNHVCRLHKALYGLKQAPYAWYTRLRQSLVHLGFTESLVDASLFTFHHNDIHLYVLVYVDDILVTGTHPTHGLHLSLSKYITDLLHRSHMAGAKPCSTPTAFGSKLSLYDDVSLSEVTEYRQIVGALQYCTLTQPDIAFSVNQLCQFMHSPTTAHWIAAKRVLRYLKGTLDHSLFFSKSSLTLHAFCDSDLVARSSTEAKYHAMAITTADLYWVRMLLKDLHVPLSSPPVLWCDNAGALALASNPVFHARTKHIEIDYHFIREKVVNRDMSLRFISTGDQRADIFTKGLPTPRFQLLRDKLLVSSCPISLRGAVKEISLQHTQSDSLPSIAHTAHQQLKSTSTPNKEISLIDNQT
uniref:Integrase catalytic domain-containing protein n=1 Tax=Fagus sylvatica TaxID=28930 RepID=A0A2N9EGZ0_FAGSY